MVLKNGDLLDNLIAKDTFGNDFSMSNISTQYVLISFLRYSGCPFCNLSVHRLALEHPLLKENDCEIVTFIQSSPELIQKNIYERHSVKPQYPIIPDRERVHYKRFGVNPKYTNSVKMIRDIPHWVHSVKKHGFSQKEIDGNVFIAPAIFILNINNNKLIHVEYASDLFSHDTFSRVYEAIAKEEAGL